MLLIGCVAACVINLYINNYEFQNVYEFCKISGYSVSNTRLDILCKELHDLYNNTYLLYCSSLTRSNLLFKF